MTTMAAPAQTGGTRTWTIPRRAESVSDTRHHVEALLKAWNRTAETVDAAMLLVTELVTNAVQHTDTSSITCTVSLHYGTVTLSVTDTGTGPHHTPEPEQPDDQKESGRGLLIVSALATDWGTHLTPDTREVWARLAS
ncbi:ATP-binding protein [Streptomyces sp. NPDC048350]|uniref:ATP-binding protein n=1 Tax=Streptomyces sp. NPDC048350 TaxID=3365538 RepID=UPI00371E7AC8